MKRYRLKIDIPFAKAGDMMEMWSDGTMAFVDDPALPRFNKKDVRMFTTWFEEVEEPKQYFSIDILKATVEEVFKIHYSEWAVENLKSLNLLFETREEAEKYLEYLEARAIIKQDAKGFKPDWKNYDEKKYLGFWDIEKDGLDWLPRNIFIEATIYFKSREDIEESFENHPEEWKAYLTYEQ